MFPPIPSTASTSTCAISKRGPRPWSPRGTPSCTPTCGNGDADAGFARASADGTKVFFVSNESLTAADTDSAVDVYERNLTAATTTLVSVGGSSCLPGCGNGPAGATLRGLAPNASRAFFTTSEQLSGADADSAVDIYARNLEAGTTILVSQGDASCAPGCGNSGAAPVFQTSSNDGSRVFFTSDEQLSAADQDTATDIYARDLPNGPTTLVSGGSSSILTASFAAASSDGSRAFFTTAEGLVGGDTDGANDVYEWSSGAPTLVSSATCAPGPECGSNFNTASADGSRIVFSTAERLVAADTDGAVDVYEQVVGSGGPVLVSQAEPGCVGCGSGSADARFNRASADATVVFFTSDEPLASRGPRSGRRHLRPRRRRRRHRAGRRRRGLCPTRAATPPSSTRRPLPRTSSSKRKSASPPRTSTPNPTSTSEPMASTRGGR